MGRSAANARGNLSRRFLLYSEFGKWRDGTFEFTPTSVVERSDKFEFGWRFKLQSENPEIKLKVALTLPEAPKHWGRGGKAIEKDVSDDGKVRISPDRRTSTTEDDFFISDGWVGSRWSFSEGDPVGDHVVRVYANDKLVRIFRFKVVPAKK